MNETELKNKVDNLELTREESIADFGRMLIETLTTDQWIALIQIMRLPHFPFLTESQKGELMKRLIERLKDNKNDETQN